MLRPKKSYGQHFLNSSTIAEKIVNSLSDYRGNIVEVGPGKGVLTSLILDKKSKNFIAVDADDDMVEYLQKNFNQNADQFVKANFLRWEPKEYFGNESFKIIGNFPYNISSQIVFKAIEWRHSVDELVGMFQKEMAERIVAKPGSRTYGVISVFTQAFFEGQVLFNVSPGSFIPPPRVMSAVIRLKRNKTDKLDCDEAIFKTVVKNSFNQRRKMLRNTLKSLIKDELLLKDELFTKRPENLSVEEFVGITQKIEIINNELRK